REERGIRSKACRELPTTSAARAVRAFRPRPASLDASGNELGEIPRTRARPWGFSPKRASARGRTFDRGPDRERFGRPGHRLREVARRPVSGRDLAERRVLLGTDRLRHEAAGMEAAPRGRVRRTRHVAL